MGLFSSKKKVTVTTTVMRMIEDDQLPESTKSGVIKGVLKDLGISESLVESLVESPALKAHRMYDYAKKHYVYGLPKSAQISAADSADIIKAFLERQVFREVTVDYCLYSSLNATHVGWQTLYGQYGYDAVSNEIRVLSGQKGVPVYLKDMVAVYTQEAFDQADPGSLNPVGPPATAGYTPERAAQFSLGLAQYLKPSLYVVDPAATQNKVRVTYVFKVTVSYVENGITKTREELREGQLIIPVTLDVDESDFYQVMFRYLDSQGKERVEFWTYEDGSGEYPEIDGIFLGDYAEAGSYFPFVYFRYGGQDITTNDYRGTSAFQTSTKMLKYLGVDYAQLGRDINSNPDIGSVLQAFMMMAVPAESESEVEQRYLYQYFNVLYLANAKNDDPYTTLQPGRAIRIKDKKFTVSFNYSGLYKKRYAGKVGARGSYSSGVGSKAITETYRTFTGQLATRQNNHKYLYYRKQVSASHYDEIRVYAPNMVYFVAGKYVTVGGIGSKKLLIPLDRAISDSMPATWREELYLRSLHLVFNTYQETETKWYQSGAFKVIMIVVAVAIIVFTGGTGTALAAALHAGVAATAYAVVSMVVEALVVQYAFKMFAKAVGPELAMLVAVVAAAYGVYRAVDAGGLANSVTAQRMLKAATGLMDASSVELNTRLSSNYNSELAEFELMKDKMTAEMKEWEKLLDTKSLIDPFEFVGQVPFFIMGESPTNTYARTIHSGNIGALSVDSVSHFVNLSLKLPTLDETVGDSLYV